MVWGAGGREAHAGAAHLDAGREQGGHHYYYQRHPSLQRLRQRPHEHRHPGDATEQGEGTIEQRHAGMGNAAADEPVEEKLPVRLERILTRRIN
jgi:hypothetical protein